MLIPVILSGGAGTRLWPVSRKTYPKPFMQMGDGQSLLHKTLARAQSVADGPEVITVTSRDHYFITRDEYRGRIDDADARFLLEPLRGRPRSAVAGDHHHRARQRRPHVGRHGQRRHALERRVVVAAAQPAVAAE